MSKYDLDANMHYRKAAYRLACLSQLAYDNDPETDTEFTTVFPNRKTFPAGMTQGFVAGNDKHVVVAFRGTDEPRDWIDNLRYVQIAKYGGKVHQGFEQNLDKVWSTVSKAVADFRKANQTIWITGHSLGGALAVLTSLRLKSARLRSSRTYTFGAPRVLDPRATAACNLKHHRYVNYEDIVPHFPFPGFFNRFEHTGDLEFILASGNMASSGRSWQIVANRVMRIMAGNYAQSVGSFTDHRIVNYVSKLKRHA